MTSRLLILLLLVAGLGTIERTKVVTIDPGLTKYHDSFMEQVTAMCKEQQYYYPKNVTISFGNMKSPEIGECGIGTRFNTKLNFFIKIDKQYWDKSNEVVRQSLMFHEMTHCVLGLDHVDDSNNYMYPEMNESLTKEVIETQTLANIKAVCNVDKR